MIYSTGPLHSLSNHHREDQLMLGQTMFKSSSHTLNWVWLEGVGIIFPKLPCRSGEIIFATDKERK